MAYAPRSLVDKELKSIRKMRDVNAMAGVISQAKRQMTSKVVRESQKISNFSGEKPLKTLESVSTSERSTCNEQWVDSLPLAIVVQLLLLITTICVFVLLR